VPRPLRRADRARRRLRELRSELERRIASREQFVAAVERQAAEAQVHPTVAPVGDRDALISWWRDATADQRSDLASWALGRVVIQPATATRWDPRRIQVLISWPAGLAAAVDPDTLDADERAAALRLAHEPPPDAPEAQLA
jgi:hypothetical protein